MNFIKYLKHKVLEKQAEKEHNEILLKISKNELIKLDLDTDDMYAIKEGNKRYIHWKRYNLVKVEELARIEFTNDNKTKASYIDVNTVTSYPDTYRILESVGFVYKEAEHCLYFKENVKTKEELKEERLKKEAADKQAKELELKIKAAKDKKEREEAELRALRLKEEQLEAEKKAEQLRAFDLLVDKFMEDLKELNLKIKTGKYTVDGAIRSINELLVSYNITSFKLEGIDERLVDTTEYKNKNIPVDIKFIENNNASSYINFKDENNKVESINSWFKELHNKEVIKNILLNNIDNLLKSNDYYSSAEVEANLGYIKRVAELTTYKKYNMFNTKLLVFSKTIETEVEQTLEIAGKYPKEAENDFLYFQYMTTYLKILNKFMSVTNISKPGLLGAELVSGIIDIEMLEDENNMLITEIKNNVIDQDTLISILNSYKFPASTISKELSLTNSYGTDVLLVYNLIIKKIEYIWGYLALPTSNINLNYKAVILSYKDVIDKLETLNTNIEYISTLTEEQALKIYKPIVDILYKLVEVENIEVANKNSDYTQLLDNTIDELDKQVALSEVKFEAVKSNVLLGSTDNNVLMIGEAVRELTEQEMIDKALLDKIRPSNMHNDNSNKKDKLDAYFSREV